MTDDESRWRKWLQDADRLARDRADGIDVTTGDARLAIRAAQVLVNGIKLDPNTPTHLRDDWKNVYRHLESAIRSLPR